MFHVNATITIGEEKYDQTFSVDTDDIDEAKKLVSDAPTSELIGKFYGRKQGMYIAEIEYHIESLSEVNP